MNGPSDKAVAGAIDVLGLDPDNEQDVARAAAVMAALEGIWIERWNQLISGLHVALGKPGEGLDSMELVEAVAALRASTIAEVVAKLREGELVRAEPIREREVYDRAAAFVEREFGGE